MTRACIARAEAGDGAVHDRVGKIGRGQPESLRDTGAESLEHDVGASGECGAEVGISFEVPHDRLLARVERVVPAGSDRADRVPVGCLHPHDPRAEPQELAAGEGAGQVAREIDDQHAA